MPSKTGKSIANTYKNDLTINQSGNTGLDSVARNVQDGDGNDSCLKLSDDVLHLQPQNDNGQDTFLVKNSGGTNILAIDTINKIVKGGANDINLLTQYVNFGIDASSSAGFGADIHYMIPFGLSESGSSATSMGSSTSSSFNDTNPIILSYLLIVKAFVVVP